MLKKIKKVENMEIGFIKGLKNMLYIPFPVGEDTLKVSKIIHVGAQFFIP